MPISLFVYSTQTGIEVQLKKLKHMMPRTMELKAMRAANVDLGMDGNMKSLRSLAVYHKASSEMNTKYYLKLQSRDMQDLMQRSSEKVDNSSKLCSSLSEESC